MAYLTAYLADPIWFLDTWRSLYFGYYIYDAAMILICWRRLFGSFRTFYTIHHVFSFTITGLWMAAGGVWLDYIILGVMLWLASDLWAYGLAMIRSTRGRQWSRLEIARLKLAVFWIERVHRGLAYVVPWIIADFHLSAFAILVLGTGLANDILDAGFQWRSIRRTRVRRRPLSPMKRLFYQPT